MKQTKIRMEFYPQTDHEKSNFCPDKKKAKAHNF